MTIKKLCGIFFCLYLTHAKTFPQVVIGDTVPDSTAVLKIVSRNKGVILPVLPDNITLSVPDYALFFIDEKNAFQYKEGNSIYYLNPFVARNKDTILSDIRIADSKTLSVTGDGEFIARGLLPVGAIVMFNIKSNDYAAIPEGYQACDGALIDDSESPLYGNHTPDLRGRFVVCWDPRDSDYLSPGNLSEGGDMQGTLGGFDFQEIRPENLPPHQHALTYYPDEADWDLEITVSNDSLWSPTTPSSPDGFIKYFEGKPTLVGHRHVGRTSDGSEYGHPQKQVIDNRPKYKVACYIMRIK